MFWKSFIFLLLLPLISGYIPSIVHSIAYLWPTCFYFPKKKKKKKVMLQQKKVGIEGGEKHIVK